MIAMHIRKPQQLIGLFMVYTPSLRSTRASIKSPPPVLKYDTKSLYPPPPPKVLQHDAGVNTPPPPPSPKYYIMMQESIPHPRPQITCTTARVCNIHGLAEVLDYNIIMALRLCTEICRVPATVRCAFSPSKSGHVLCTSSDSFTKLERTSTVDCKEGSVHQRFMWNFLHISSEHEISFQAKCGCSPSISSMYGWMCRLHDYKIRSVDCH